MALNPKRSIKPWIPQVGPNDPDKYDAYEYRPYPRMMTKLCTQKDLDAWLERNSYVGDNGKTAYKGSRPRIGSPIAYMDDANRPIIVNSEAEEAEFIASHPPETNVARVEVPALSSVTHSAEIAAKEKEIEALKAQLSNKPKPGRPPKAKSDLPEKLSAA